MKYFDFFFLKAKPSVAPPVPQPQSEPACLRPIREYGCTRCQVYHIQGLDPLYDDHLMWQSKHGWSERFPTPNEVLKRIGMEPEETKGGAM